MLTLTGTVKGTSAADCIETARAVAGRYFGTTPFRIVPQPARLLWASKRTTTEWVASFEMDFHAEEML